MKSTFSTEPRIFVGEDRIDLANNYGYLGGWLGTLTIMFAVHESWLLDIIDRRF